MREKYKTKTNELMVGDEWLGGS